MNIDYLQIALLFLIVLLSFFLTITGIQVFLILRDLKKTLDRFNKVIQSGEVIVKDLEKPVSATSSLVTALETKARALVKRKPKSASPKSRRFYKKVL